MLPCAVANLRDFNHSWQKIRILKMFESAVHSWNLPSMCSGKSIEASRYKTERRAYSSDTTVTVLSCMLQTSKRCTWVKGIHRKSTKGSLVNFTLSKIISREEVKQPVAHGGSKTLVLLPSHVSPDSVSIILQSNIQKAQITGDKPTIFSLRSNLFINLLMIIF